MTWTVDNTMRPKGISVDILVSGSQWKRCDGFGHMTDKEVEEYWKARPGRR